MTFSVKGADRPGIAKEIPSFISAIKDVEIADMSQVNVVFSAFTQTQHRYEDKEIFQLNVKS